MTGGLTRVFAAKRRRGARASGFTLIELTISLVAGLMVAMAVMGVSREATATFHEEVRVSGAEMSVRIAMERIRLDLQRAAFMSTGNIQGDPLIARMANYAGATPALSNFIGAAAPYSMATLSGIALRPSLASVMNDGAAFSQLQQPNNNLAPDTIDIGGNMSSSDEYAASVVWNPANSGPCAGGAAISIEMTTPAGWRIRNAEAAGALAPGYVPGTALQAIFHPGASTSSSFLIRLTDQSGRSQYLVGCAGGVGLGTNYSALGTVPTALVYLSPSSMILSTNNTGGLGGVAGFAAGWVTVAPVEVARWDIQTPAQFTATSATSAATYLYGQTLGGLTDPSDFLLTRSYLDFSGVCGSSAPCPVDPMTTEVVSEYAVDLKFGLTIDMYNNPNCIAFPCPNVAPNYTSNPLINTGMDGLAAAGGIPFAAPTLVGWTPNVGPQRIRDVQVRIGVRSPFGDRPWALPIVGSTAASPSYLYRYELDATASHFAPAHPYARVRENTTEVNLSNQTRFYW
jgi:type II secretory pathway pseudopilin PulG